MYTPGTVGDQAIQEELNRIAKVLRKVVAGKLQTYTREPAKPEDGDLVICDGVNWNPLLDGAKRPVWYDGDTHSWVAF